MSPKSKPRLPLGGCFLALLAVAGVLGLYAWNLWGSPAFGSLADQPYHLKLGEEFDRAWRDGDAPPRWAAGANGGRGSIGFVLYPPFFAFLTACWLQLGASTVEALRLAVLTAAAGSFAAILYLARGWLSWRRSLLAAVLVMLLPGVTFIALGRGMFPHFTALGWAALLLGAGQRALLGKQLRLNIALAAVAAAGLVITHSLSAYLLAFLLLVISPLLVKALGWKGMAWAAAVAIAGTLLSSWYWLPLIQAGAYAGVDYLDESHPYLNSVLGASVEASSGVFQKAWTFLNQIGRYIVLAQSLLALLLAFALWPKKAAPGTGGNDSGNSPPQPVLFVRALPWVAGFAFLAATEPVARLLLELPNFTWVQFSWRWQSLIALWCGVGLAALPWEKKSAPAAALAVATLLFFSPLLLASKVQPLDPTHPLPPAVTEAQFEELTPMERSAYAGNMLGLRPSRADRRYYRPAEFGKTEVVSGEARVEPRVLRTSYREYWIAAVSDTTVRIETYHAPGWSARLDRQPVEVREDAASGLQLVSVPAGTHRLELRYQLPWPWSSPQQLPRTAASD
jgi:hypothetical protein